MLCELCKTRTATSESRYGRRAMCGDCSGLWLKRFLSYEVDERLWNNAEAQLQDPNVSNISEAEIFAEWWTEQERARALRHGEK